VEYVSLANQFVFSYLLITQVYINFLLYDKTTGL
jgi:hypothetical protein